MKADNEATHPYCIRMQIGNKYNVRLAAVMQYGLQASRFYYPE